ncbi:Z1 domain-containing protein [Streptomyces sp. NBC_01351]|uniref:Z1 domain-containing protein n=1 Tax=Streptomyces sp. NBC_01351 TaxID=2903833 RepID=UPI002E376D80|nr:Z1 domain-containing protein [Streptomyces sp. NBC_01351]
MTNSETLRLELHSAVLADLDGSKPKNLARALVYQAEDMAPEAAAYAHEADFQAALKEARSTHQLVELWRRQLTRWDYSDRPTWTDTPPRTDERRAEVHRLLKLDEATRVLLDGLIPVSKAAGSVVISPEHKPWYTPQSQLSRPHYWPAYRGLLAAKGWPADAVAALDAATDQVVERLADPTDSEVYQSKGLVVGYVQSGKTANFTGVMAKAVDAGYRLVIVLGGTLNMLRAQTQRRLDMELVGKENILRGAGELESDYADDPAWAAGKFVSHGSLPSALGAFDIVRMTTRDDDYKSLLQGITALEFEKREPALPLYDRENLHRSSARLMVVKKNKTVLAKLVKDLGKIKTPLAEIPVLIIDDESDEASVNTSKPDVRRSAINEQISKLLNMLPRAQYVGYTATPFANVFVDPSDTEDIFPKDFLISLPRPDGYMGARDFHDLDGEVEEHERTVANSNEKAHVRDIVDDAEDDTCLRQAMDMFVLTAAMKLYREDAGGLGDGYFEHHTMLVHESVRTGIHRDLHDRVLNLWHDAGYTGPRGHERLRKLFETDVAPVSRVRADGQAVPASYDELMRYVGPASVRIGGDGQPIIVVNGDKDLETGEADFDKRPVWKILIGGQKLARGFTVEGLTVSFFRRRAGNASTLMQMGRWFGFRRGYRDLVRLYLGRRETMGRTEVDLYDAFQAICLDEEAFRSELRRYAAMVDGRPQITPAEIPPLVSQHLPWLRPASPNKMYNARLVLVRSAGCWEEPTAYPQKGEDLRHNTELWLPYLESLGSQATTYGYHFPDEGNLVHRFRALSGIFPAATILDTLRDLRWEVPEQFLPHLRYLSEITQAGKVDDWVVLAPQHASGSEAKTVTLGSAGRSYSWFSRDRRAERGPLFGAISDKKHRGVAHRIAGALGSSGDGATEALVADRRGAIVLYPVIESAHQGSIGADRRVDASRIVTAFTFVAPASAHSANGQVVQFTTISSKAGAIIDVTEIDKS